VRCAARLKSKSSPLSKERTDWCSWDGDIPSSDDGGRRQEARDLTAALHISPSGARSFLTLKSHDGSGVSDCMIAELVLVRVSGCDSIDRDDGMLLGKIQCDFGLGHAR
jgi:hypothetical protein